MDFDKLNISTLTEREVEQVTGEEELICNVFAGGVWIDSQKTNETNTGSAGSGSG